MPRIASILDLRLPATLIPEFARIYSASIADLPPELNLTFLLQSEVDATLLRIHDYWLRGAAPALIREPPHLRACLAFLESAGFRASASNHVVLDKGHPLIGQRR